MSPDEFRAWVRAFRDFVIILVGSFLLVHEALASDPNIYVIGAGLAAFGLPPVLRLDDRRRLGGDGDAG